MAPLTRETKIGLNYGQIMSVIGLLMSLMGVYVKLSNDIAVAKSEIQAQKEWSIMHQSQNREDFRTVVLDIRESLNEIKQDIKEIKR